MQVFAYIPIVIVGISALLIKTSPSRPVHRFGGAMDGRRRRGAPLAGLLSILTGSFALALVYYFHENLGLTGGYYTATILAPVIVFVAAAVWYLVARGVASGQGVNLDLTYKAIPPD